MKLTKKRLKEIIKEELLTEKKDRKKVAKQFEEFSHVVNKLYSASSPSFNVFPEVKKDLKWIWKTTDELRKVLRQVALEMYDATKKR